MVMQAQDQAKEVLRLFVEGKSKAEIGRLIGKDKKQVASLLARAIKERGNGND